MVTQNNNERQLQLRVNETRTVEGDVHAELVAIDILTAYTDGYYDPEVERMTMRQAAKIASEIDHPSMDNANVDLRAVYQDLELRYEDACTDSGVAVAELRAYQPENG